MLKKRSFLKRAQYAVLTLAAYALAFTARRLPHGAALSLGACVGGLMHAALGSRRRVARQNVDAAFPEKTAPERQNIVRAHFRHLGQNIVELLLFPQWERRFQARVQIVGRAEAEKAAEKGRGVILFIPHTGNWEILAPLSPQFLPKPMAIAQPLPHRSLEALAIRCRSGAGLELTPREGALKKVVRGLREGRAAGFLADQDAGPSGIPTLFFGRYASAERSPAALSRKLGCPLLLCAPFRNGGGKHTVFIETITQGGSDRETLQNIYARLEQLIRERPSQWLWTHRRWKTEFPSSSP